MYTVIIVLTVITAILLCLVVLIQDSKSGGLASNYASSNAIMGVRKTTDVIEKTTWTLAAILVLLCIASTYFAKGSTSSDEQIMQIQAQPTAPVSTAIPTAPTAPTEAATPTQN
ncbi:MAG: preprotein translocase subunit SecG [Bacteroidales bacterium]|nr:preprotein translocase subunit SecG [Bacteroidales bacterium]